MIYSALKRTLTVLDDYGYETHGEEWDDLVIDDIERMHGRYGNLKDPERELQDYSSLASNLGYLFMYAAGHAELVAHTLKDTVDVCGHPVFKKDELRVASVGGGPGSELLGLVHFLESNQPESLPKKIIYTIYDKEPSWEHVSSELIDSIETEIDIDVSFRPIDVTGDCSGETLAGNHLIIMSFFISEVSNLPCAGHVKSSVNHLLKSVSSKAYLLYNDNSNRAFYEFFNYRRYAAGKFEQLYDSDPTQFEVKNPDIDGIFADMIERFGRTPKLSAFSLSKLLRRT